MQHIKLSPSGPAFSRIVAGIWRWQGLPVEHVRALIQGAVDLGITTFDLADIYGDYTNENSSATRCVLTRNSGRVYRS